MRRMVFVLVLVMLASGAYCANDQAFLGIFAETSVMKMAGMPAMPKMELPQGMDLSKIPGMEAMMAMGQPKRGLNVRLWSPGLAPKDAFAHIAPPSGLKVGKRMDLALYRPKPGKGLTSEGGEGAPGDAQMKGFTIKIYWGSSATVKPGQPKIIKFDGLTAEQRGTMQAEAKKAKDAASSYFYKPDWTTGYWPTPKQPGKIAGDAALEGNYALTTNYTGNVAIDCPANVNFLDAFDFTSPDIQAQIPLDDAIQFEWKQIPNALGLHASIFGMEGKNTLILWSSSEVYSDMAMGSWDYLQMAEVRSFVEKTVMMKGEATSVTVPKAIFANCDMANMMMVGYGPGAALATGQPLPRIQTKTTLTMPLGGKMMKGMGAMPGMEIPEPPEDDQDSGE